MRNSNHIAARLSGILACAIASHALAQDWPQWMGSDRDAKASFDAPKAWPESLAQQWKVTVGDGVATPALVGDKLYVFARQEGKEVLRCLAAADGKEIWKDAYEAMGASGPAGGFAGPRSSPAVGEGKVVALGVRGMLSCLDAATGKVLWRKNDFEGSIPRFAISSSPLIADGMCIAQLGGSDNGALVAYDLAGGEQKWKWTGEGPGYASPILMTVDGMKLIIAETERRIVAVRLADGRQVWETPFVAESRSYNASTPAAVGQVLIFSGANRGTRAVQLRKEGDGIAGKELWHNADQSAIFNSPVLKDGLLYGLSSSNELFCLDTKTGKALWTQSIGPAGGGESGRGGRDGRNDDGPRTRPAEGSDGRRGRGNREEGRGPDDRREGRDRSERGDGREGSGPDGGREGRGRSGRGGSRGGYGSIVDAGSVLIALTPASQLIVFAPGDKPFTEQAKIKVADTPTYAYPVLSADRVFIKDQDSVMLWKIQ